MNLPLRKIILKWCELNDKINDGYDWEEEEEEKNEWEIILYYVKIDD